MWIIRVDYHPSMQQIAWLDMETGECGERRLAHCAEAEQFYRQLKQKGVSVRVGMEATGHSRWFERLLAELNFEVWLGDPAQIRASDRVGRSRIVLDAEPVADQKAVACFPHRKSARISGIGYRRVHTLLSIDTELCQMMIKVETHRHHWQHSCR